MTLLTTNQINTTWKTILETVSDNFNWTDRGFCIQCGTNVKHFSGRTLFCSNCKDQENKQLKLSTHAVVYSLYKEIERLNKIVGKK